MESSEKNEQNIFDLIIIGAGIIGLTTAYSFQKLFPKSKILILEKEKSPMQHQTGRNSGVIHSGIYYKPNSSKSINCIKGYKLLLDFARKNSIKHEITGKLIVATKKSQIKSLKKLYDYGLQKKLKGVKLIGPDEILKIEPYCTSALKALYVPQAGIIDYKEVGKKLIEIITAKNGKIKYSKKVKKILNSETKATVYTKDDLYTGKNVVVCAGIYSDYFSNEENQKKVRIFPFKGEYFKLKDEASYLVKGLIYPTPNMNFPFLGVHLTKTVNKGIEAGPNAVLAFSREGYKKFNFNIHDFLQIISWKGFLIFSLKYWHIGLYEIYRSFNKNAFLKSLNELIPSIKKNQIERIDPGIRAQALSNKGLLFDEFLIEENDKIINVINAPSPAATSCFAISNKIVDLIKSKKYLD